MMINCNKLEQQKIKALAATTINSSDIYGQSNRFIRGGEQ